MLTVLENLGLTNVVAVVTRYFGGTKLGAGGLIRAYGSTVADAIKGIGIVSIKEQVGLTIHFSYPHYQRFSNWLQTHGLQEVDPQFTDKVETTIFVDEEQVESIQSDLVDYYHGDLSIQKSGVRMVEVPIT
ncbi:protein co-occurring with transport system [Streptococcus sp. DD13]|nr:protein co-occurring with transport system [Streptococcus sp. DD13]